jgi:predicted NUDIX family phosphoesterase
MVTTQRAEQKNQEPLLKNNEEHVLVVKRSILFPDEAWQGLENRDNDYYLQLIQQEKEFLPRALMENDSSYKQIIPYLIFTFNNTYFLMQRQAKSSEQRLKNKYSLGIGGHIRAEDMSSDSIIDWARREFEEEINYQGIYTVKPLGILNDDSNSVGEVHLGFVFLLEGTSSAISVKSELKSGELLSLAQCEAYYPQMESWSQIIVNFLR